MVMAFSTRSPNPGKKRSLLVKGSWTLSWRSSKKNLESESSTEDAQQDNPQSSPSSVPRRAVQFDEAKLVTEIPEEENPITPSELDMIWYKNDDYTRFEKDRVLTSFGYISKRRSGSRTVDDDEYTTRGLEPLCDPRLGRRQFMEKKELAKALKAEEIRQKKESEFPNFDRFRSVSVKHSNASRDRALTVAQEDARENRARSNSTVVDIILTRGLSLRLLKRKNNASGTERRRSFS